MDDRVSCHQVTEDEKPLDKSNMQSLFKKNAHKSRTEGTLLSLHKNIKNDCI